MPVEKYELNRRIVFLNRLGHSGYKIAKLLKREPCNVYRVLKRDMEKYKEVPEAEKIALLKKYPLEVNKNPYLK